MDTIFSKTNFCASGDDRLSTNRCGRLGSVSFYRNTATFVAEVAATLAGKTLLTAA
jgi:hypothetical protein